MVINLLPFNPGGREKMYEQFSGDPAAIEPPFWFRPIAGYFLDLELSVELLDTKLDSMSVETIRYIEEMGKARLVRAAYS